MKTVIFSLLTILLLSSAPVSAAGISFNMLKATPVGSWQLREDIETNHKGKKTGSTIKSSMVGTETRDGKKHYWVEMAIDTFKMNRKGKRKPTGDRVIVKSLIPADMFSDDPANVMNNIRTFGVETIMQSGNEDPMRMADTSGMMAGVMDMTQAEMVFDFEQVGKETVTVPAGTFKAQKVAGSGSVSMKIIFKKINVETDTTVWLSNKVPFGTVKVDATSTTNGKASSNSSQLLEFGLSGAVSEITKEPKDMPQIPNIFGG